jgi:hypothetical protein
MRYQSMSENEAEWEILVVSRNGKSFVGWSFDCDRQFNFNVSGIVWAEDLATHKRIAKFAAYLDDLFPKPVI